MEHKKSTYSNYHINFLSSFASADWETGNSLLSKLDFEESPHGDLAEMSNFAKAWGYLLGVFDEYDGVLWEAPEGLTEGQIVDSIKKYLKEHPEERQKPATDLLIMAFKEAFPKNE